MKLSKELQNKIRGMIDMIGTSQPVLQKLGRVLNATCPLRVARQRRHLVGLAKQGGRVIKFISLESHKF